MGYGIQVINKHNKEVAFFHYHMDEKDKPLHKVLNVKISDNNKVEKPYSKGQLLDAKSKLMNISGTLGEQDFLSACLLEMKETNVTSILITFN